MHMATIHLEPGRTYTEQAMAANGLRRPLFPAVRWGAVLAGVAVGISVQLALTLLGIASGLFATDIAQGESMGMGPLIWSGISTLIAAFFGAYVAARKTVRKRKADGVLHGVVSWAVTTLLFATLATSAGGSLLSGIFSNMVPAMARGVAGSVGGGGNAEGALALLLKNQIGGNVYAESLNHYGGTRAPETNARDRLIAGIVALESSSTELLHGCPGMTASGELIVNL